MWTFSVLFYVKSLLFVLIACVISNVTSVENTKSFQCSGIYTRKNFLGNKLEISNEIGWTYKGHLRLIPNSIKVSSNCSLSLFDGVGYIQTVHEDMQNFTWIRKNPIHSTCCHCGNCNTLKISQNECARVYEHENCNGCGKPLVFTAGQEIRNFHLIRNRIGSVVVREGCSLHTFYEMKTATWEIMVKVFLKTGNNLLESLSIFNDEATVSLDKALCDCNSAKYLSSAHDSRVYVLKVADTISADIDTESKESASISISSEFLYKEQDTHDDDELY